MCVNQARRGLHAGDQLQRLRHGLVHGVRLVAQRVDHQIVDAGEQRHGLLGYAAEVGDIDQAADAVAQHGHVAMLGGNRFPGRAQQLERPFDHVRDDPRNRAQHRLAVKDVRESPPQNGQSLLIGVDRQSRFLAEVEGANVVESQDVVGVAVGIDDGVQAFQAVAQSLKAEVGGSVDDHVMVRAREQHGRPGAVVVGILRTANAAMATQAGNAHGRP